LPPGVDHLRAIGPDLVDLTPTTPVWRVHQLLGPHPTSWDELRRYGPLTSARFDPHPEPPGTRPTGVVYLASDVPTALAEVYQETRVVQRGFRGAQLTAWFPARTLRVLDLTDVWPTRAGTSHSLNSGRKDYTRSWARAVTTAWPDLDGMVYTGMTGRRCWVLYSPASDAFPSAPEFSHPLAAAALGPALAAAARQIGYLLV
jgi:hypothetical protein